MSRRPDSPSPTHEWLLNPSGERELTENDAVLWTVILVAAMFDVVTTLVGLEVGLSEGNVIAIAFIETYGSPGIGGLKFAALVTLVLVWGQLPDRMATIALQGFATISLVVVALNAVTLLGV